MNNLYQNTIANLHYSATVTMADGTTERIGYLVNNKVKAHILALNTVTNKIESIPILNWVHGTKAQQFIQFYSTKCDGNGRARFSCTPDQSILTPTGYKPAKDIQINDNVMLVVKDWQPSNIQMEVVTGGLLGDGCLRKIGNEKYQYRETHCKAQDEYLLWKASYFKGKTTGRHKQGGLYLETYISKVFEKQYTDFYCLLRKGKVPKDIVISPLMLAIWYQDDGSFVDGDKRAIKLCTNCFDLQSIEILRSILKNEYGIITKTSTSIDTGTVITLGTKETKKFFDICGQYIHPVMRYKVPLEYRSIDFIEPTREFETEKYFLKTSTILDKYNKPLTRSMKTFNLLTDNQNFFIDGVIVGN